MAYKPFDLTGKVALVTGGNGGIGLGMATALAGQGASVAIWGTNPAKNAAAAEQLRAIGNPVLDLVCDVGDHQAVIDGMATVVAELGRIDSCFVNAGVGVMRANSCCTKTWRTCATWSLASRSTIKACCPAGWREYCRRVPDAKGTTRPGGPMRASTASRVMPGRMGSRAQAVSSRATRLHPMLWSSVREGIEAFLKVGQTKKKH